MAHEPSKPPELIDEDQNSLLGTWEDLFFIVWKRETTLAAVQRSGVAVRRFMLSKPQGIGLLAVVEERAPMPSAAARAALAELLRIGAGHIQVSAVVFEGAGFRAAAVRAVVTGLTLLARQPYPHRVFESIEAAVQWMVAVGPPRWVGTDKAALRALEQLRTPS